MKERLLEARGSASSLVAYAKKAAGETPAAVMLCKHSNIFSD